MSARPPAQPSTVHAPARDPGEAAPHERAFLLIAIPAFVMDLAIAGWLAFGPVDVPQEMRIPLALVVLVGGVAGLFALRHVWRQRFGA